LASGIKVEDTDLDTAVAFFTLVLKGRPAGEKRPGKFAKGVVHGVARKSPDN
jgi:hypothetical protein